MRAKDDGVRYPATPLGAYLRLIARLIKADTGTRVFYAASPATTRTSGSSARTTACSTIWVRR
jgi:hypothetical protein